MGLFSSTPPRRMAVTSPSNRALDVQQNLVGTYISLLQAHRDTQGVVADIKRANDAVNLSGVSSVRLQRYLLDHIEDRVAPKERPRIRNQILRDFPADARGRHQAEQFDHDVLELRAERDQVWQRYTRAEQQRELEQSARRRAQQELSHLRRESQAVIERLDEELAAATHKCSMLEDTINAAHIVLAQRTEAMSLPTPRSRPQSLYGRPQTAPWRPPSLVAEATSASVSAHSLAASHDEPAMTHDNS